MLKQLKNRSNKIKKIKHLINFALIYIGICFTQIVKICMRFVKTRNYCLIILFYLYVFRKPSEAYHSKHRKIRFKKCLSFVIVFFFYGTRFNTCASGFGWASFDICICRVGHLPQNASRCMFTQLYCSHYISLCGAQWMYNRSSGNRAAIVNRIN